MASIKEVAEAAGVSVSTVSRVLNGKSYVSETTRQRVLEVVQQKQFQLNVVAKSLKIRRSNTICLMVPAIENLMVPPIVRGVEDTARKSGFTVVLCNTDEDGAIERAYIEKMKTRWIDGFVICSAFGSEECIYSLHKEGFPIVLVNRYQESDVNQLDIVSVDNYRSAYDATRYLIRSGYKRIAFAFGRDKLLLYQERYRGYCSALKEFGLPYREELVMREVDGVESFYPLTHGVMALPEPPDAIFASSDPKAFVIMRALHDLGKRIPQDVAVMGFDNVPISSIVEPPLSTMAQPFYEIGCVAAKSLLRQISYKEKNGTLPPAVHNVMGVELIVRRSTN